MANIKISELNELYGHQRAYDDYIPVVDSSADETKKISVASLIPNNVNIIAVTDTAPVEYETGDKYYNTDENKIYTATSWGWENPQTPIGGILYVILAEQKTYAYNGNTLISVGGGSGSITVHNTYSTSTTEPYSANYVNGAISGAIVSTYTNNQTSAYSTEYANSAFGGKILWTNPNPTANFNAQTITLNSGDYDMYEVICSPGSGSTATQTYVSSGRILKGKNYICQLVNLAGNSLKSRTITYVSATSLSVAVGYDSGITNPSITQGAGHLIPQYVIGYKTGMFN